MLFDADMDEIAGIAELLGGAPVLKKSLETWAEVHDAILAGLPVAARGHFIDYFGDIEEAPDAIDACGGPHRWTRSCPEPIDANAVLEIHT